MRIADRWGCSLKELLTKTDSRELDLWIAYYAREGWSETRADYRAAITAWAIVSSLSGTKCKLEDFIIKFGEDSISPELEKAKQEAEKQSFIQDFLNLKARYAGERQTIISEEIIGGEHNRKGKFTTNR